MSHDSYNAAKVANFCVSKVIRLKKMATFALYIVMGIMRTHTIFAVVVLVAALFGCAGNDRQANEPTVGTTTSIEGDSTLYGLACEGCTDSVVVMLKGDGSDPVTYDIIDAMREGRVAGRLEVGDWICLTLDESGENRARNVIDLDKLKGTWVQTVVPELRRKHIENESLDEEEKAEQDSIIDALLAPYEIGFAIKRHYTASPVGMTRQDAEGDSGPVIYKQPKHYSEWHVFNGRLVLLESVINEGDSTGTADKELRGDTAEVVMLTKDSLRLLFQDGETQGYHRQ